MSHSDFDFSRDDASHPRARRVPEKPPLVEITGADVWEATKSGIKMAFVIGCVGGCVVALTGGGSESDADNRYLITFAFCLGVLPLVWVPLALGTRATSRRKDFVAVLLRLFAALFISVYGLAVIAILATVFLERATRAGV